MTLDEVVIDLLKAQPRDARLGASRPGEADQAARQATTSDATELLRGVPGVSVSGAGGISSLPAIHGLADDRLRIQVDGTDLMPACPNHMNSPLSYADPTRVESVTVFSGIAPVSVGGDSIGGSIQVKSTPPEFARPGEPLLLGGRAGTFYRSNGDVLGYTLGATAAGEWLSLTLGSRTPAPGTSGPEAPSSRSPPAPRAAAPFPADVIASSAFRGSVQSVARARRAAVRATSSTRAEPADGRLRGLPEPAHGHDRQRQPAGHRALHGRVRLGRSGGAA